MIVYSRSVYVCLSVDRMSASSYVAIALKYLRVFLHGKWCWDGCCEYSVCNNACIA